MTDNQKIHQSVWLAWLVLHGYLLCFRFSLAALTVLALAAVILLLCTFKNSRYAKGTLCNTLGHVLGCSLFVQLGWCFVERILPRILTGEDWIADFGGNLVLRMQNLMLFVFRDEAMLIPLVVAAVLFVLRFRTGSKPRLSMLASYAGSAVLMCPILNTIYHSHIAVLLYILVTLVFVWADLWHIAVEEEWNKCGKRWFNVLSLLLLLALSWDWYMLRPLLRPGALETIFVLEATRWQHLLVCGGVLGGLLAAFGCCAPDHGKVGNDIKIVTAGISMLLLTAFLKWFYVGWWWLLVLVNVLYLFADAAVIHPRVADDEDAVLNSWLVQVGVGVISILIAVTGHFGTWPMLLALAGSLLTAVAGVGLLLDKEKEDLYLPGGVLTAVLAILIPAVTWLWMYRRLAISFHLLLILAAVVLVIAALLSWNVTRDDRKNILAPLCAAVLFALVVLNLCMTGGSRIEMDLNDRGVPVVSAEARGEENQVVSVEYRWTEDWLNLDEGTFAFHGEEEVTGLNRLMGRDGKLRVIVTDRCGIVTETIFWMHQLPAEQ